MNVAVVVARGGSKRVPGKNLRMMGGKALVTWPILAAVKSGVFDKTIVSTDDSGISRIAEECGAVSLPRSEKTASDTASVLDVIREVIGYLDERQEKTDTITAFLGTSAFVTGATLRSAMEYIEGDMAVDFVIPVQAYPHSPDRSLRIDEKGMLGPAFPDKINLRSQETQEYFRDAAQFYMGRTKVWRKVSSPFLCAVRPIRLGTWEAIDIDTEEDLRVADHIKQLQLEAEANY